MQFIHFSLSNSPVPLRLFQHFLKDIQNIRKFSVMNGAFHICHFLTWFKLFQFFFIINHDAFS